MRFARGILRKQFRGASLVGEQVLAKPVKAIGRSGILRILLHFGFHIEDFYFLLRLFNVFRRLWGNRLLWAAPPELLYIKFTSKDQTLILTLVFQGHLECLGVLLGFSKEKTS